MKTFTHIIEIQASPAHVWALLADLEHWHEWTESITHIERLDLGTPGVGRQFHIKQPALGAAVWTITRWEPERSFTWETRSITLDVTAQHRIVPQPSGARLELELRFLGMWASLKAVLGGATARRSLALQAEGLKLAAEARAGA
jgi:hypothetical protein